MDQRHQESKSTVAIIVIATAALIQADILKKGKKKFFGHIESEQACVEFTESMVLP